MLGSEVGGGDEVMGMMNVCMMIRKGTAQVGLRELDVRYYIFPLSICTYVEPTPPIEPIIASSLRSRDSHTHTKYQPTHTTFSTIIHPPPHPTQEEEEEVTPT